MPGLVSYGNGPSGVVLDPNTKPPGGIMGNSWLLFLLQLYQNNPCLVQYGFKASFLLLKGFEYRGFQYRSFR